MSHQSLITNIFPQVTWQKIAVVCRLKQTFNLALEYYIEFPLDKTKSLDTCIIASFILTLPYDKSISLP